MKKIFFTMLCLLALKAVQAQHNLSIKLKDKHTGEALAGATATLQGYNIIAVSGDEGILSFTNIPAGRHVLIITCKEFKTVKLSLQFPTDKPVAEIEMEETDDHEGHNHEEEEIVITSTRSSRSIQNIPTRVEFIAGEELEEKANMKPGDLRMVLAESTGIQMQQTSPTSANASIRIQGLDGRYTQILKDGFPLYSGAAGGLSLLQTPPLDLKQVEIIKGSASTLYGGGAIAGLVNLISKTPVQERQLNFHLNGTSANGLDLNGFYSKKFAKTGITLFASRNSNAAYDPAHIDLSAIPQYSRYVVNPKLFVYFNKQTTMVVGINTMFEKRTGGDIHYIKGEGDATHSFFEKNDTRRISTEFTLEHNINAKTKLTLKNSYSYFDRNTATPLTIFNGTQKSGFTELALDKQSGNMEWIAGANVWTDDFKEKMQSNFPKRDYTQQTFGAFLQNIWLASPKLNLETGLRGDYVPNYGFHFLPRISALIKYNASLSSRIGGGMGYKAPSIFSEEAERLQYYRVFPVDEKVKKAEKSYGINADINYKTKIAGEINFSINHLFFYTNIKSPLLLQYDAFSNAWQFNNINGHIDTRGMETNIKAGYKDYKLFLGYTFTDAYIQESGIKRTHPLTPRHRINSVLMYEVEEKWKLGLEAYYFSKQRLNDGSLGRSYWVTGFMAEKLWQKFSFYINFENFLDTRQTRYGAIYTGSISNPVFKDIYAPLDGFVVNGGLKLKL